MDPIRCYSDASYNPKLKMAVLGYGMQCEKGFLICTEVIECETSHLAEIAASQKCVSDCERKGIKEMILFTDNITLKEQEITRLNTDTRVHIHWTKGHTKVRNRTPDQKLFALLDREVRHQLRHFVRLMEWDKTKKQE